MKLKERRPSKDPSFLQFVLVRIEFMFYQGVVVVIKEVRRRLREDLRLKPLLFSLAA